MDYSKTPLIALGYLTRQTLSKLLNPIKIILSDNGYWRDWRGIACLANLQSSGGLTINGDADPMSKVLNNWCKKNKISEMATFATLLTFLELVDRWDVCDDISETLAQDAVEFFSKTNQQQLTLKTLSTNSFDCDTSKENFQLLTRDDVYRAEKCLPLQHYDAFLLYADEDVHYALEMINVLEESTDNTLKLCVKDRDLLAGVSFEHEAITQLIEERCHRVIVILTSAFLNSPANTFLVNYTQALQIQQQKRKIIPCLYESTMEIPRTLKIYFLLKYTSTSVDSSVKPLYNYWEKLKVSIRNVPANIESCGTIVNNKPSFQENEQKELNAIKHEIKAIKLSAIPIQCSTGVSTAQLFTDDQSKNKIQMKSRKINQLKNKIAIPDDSKIHITKGPIYRKAFEEEELCKQTTAIDEQIDDTKIRSQSLENATSKKSTKWLKTMRKSANTWIKKRLSTS